MEEDGGLRQIRDEVQGLLDRIDVRLIELEQQPQQQERATAPIRAWRWIRRRPWRSAAAAATAGAATAALVIGPPDPSGPLYTQRPPPRESCLDLHDIAELGTCASELLGVG